MYFIESCFMCHADSWQRQISQRCCRNPSDSTWCWCKRSVSPSHSLTWTCTFGNDRMDFCGTWQQHMRLCLRGRFRWWSRRPLLLLLGHSAGSPGPSLTNTRDNIWVYSYMYINPVCIKAFDLVLWTAFAALMSTFQTFHASWMIWKSVLWQEINNNKS